MFSFRLCVSLQVSELLILPYAILWSFLNEVSCHLLLFVKQHVWIFIVLLILFVWVIFATWRCLNWISILIEFLLLWQLLVWRSRFLLFITRLLWVSYVPKVLVCQDFGFCKEFPTSFLVSWLANSYAWTINLTLSSTSCIFFLSPAWSFRLAAILDWWLIFTNHHGSS